MNIPNDLRQLAATAFSENTSWADFLIKHHDKIRLAEPYDQRRWARLKELTRSIVVSGTTSGLFGCGDLNDSRAEWFADDEPTQTTLFDMAEATP